MTARPFCWSPSAEEGLDPRPRGLSGLAEATQATLDGGRAGPSARPSPAPVRVPSLLSLQGAVIFPLILTLSLSLSLGEGG